MHAVRLPTLSCHSATTLNTLELKITQAQGYVCMTEQGKGAKRKGLAAQQAAEDAAAADATGEKDTAAAAEAGAAADGAAAPSPSPSLGVTFRPGRRKSAGAQPTPNMVQTQAAVLEDSVSHVSQLFRITTALLCSSALADLQ